MSIYYTTCFLSASLSHTEYLSILFTNMISVHTVRKKLEMLTLLTNDTLLLASSMLHWFSCNLLLSLSSAEVKKKLIWKDWFIDPHSVTNMRFSFFNQRFGDLNLQLFIHRLIKNLGHDNSPDQCFLLLHPFTSVFVWLLCFVEKNKQMRNKITCSCSCSLVLSWVSFH